MNNARVGLFPASQIRQHGKLRKSILNPVVCSVAATLSIFGGISSLVAGLICISLHVFSAHDTAFGRAGTALLIVGIPMLLLGSVFLDEADTNK